MERLVFELKACAKINRMVTDFGGKFGFTNMGYLLKEALKTLCGVNQWSYAIFWKIGCQNPKLLIWEECYYEPIICSDDGRRVQATNKVHLLVTKMMKDSYINVLGEGLVGRVAFTRNHQWIIRDIKTPVVHPPEVSNEVYTQFSAGIQTIAVIPVHPHGVVQLGSSSNIMENMGFVNDVKNLISQLGCVPGVLFSENYMNNEKAMNTSTNLQALAGPTMYRTSKKSDPKTDSQTAFGSFSANYDPLRSMEQHIMSAVFLGDHVNGDTFKSHITRESNNGVPCSLPDAHTSHSHVDKECTRVKLTSDKEKLEQELFQALTMTSEDACLKPSSRDDLFDIVGMGFKNKSFGGNNSNFVNSGVVSKPRDLSENGSGVLEPFSVYDGESDSGIYSSSTASDHLLDAVVSKIHSSSKQTADDNVSVSYTSSIWANRGSSLMKNELIGVPKCLRNTGVTSSYSYKSGISREDGGNLSDTSSIISSRISSWTDQRNEVKRDCGVAPSRTNEISKSNRKRLKPGENPRPRPKDRQMIQDRVKELREIIPKATKCSIDALLERTIKHMVFLQSVTKHVDKLKQTGESKIVRDNLEGGATWAYEVGSQSMICPIIVEDLSSPRQMLVEMLCEEGGSFLEIADVVKGLGLTILKGVMECRNDKIWAHFIVEANRDVTRMEIFISLVSRLDPGAKNVGDQSGNNANVSAHEQTFHQVATDPHTMVRPPSIR